MPAGGIAGKLYWSIGAGAGAGHASFIVNYDGPEDQNMAAALFERSNAGELFASIWVNDGEWKKLRERTVSASAIRSEDRRSRHILVDFQRVGSMLELRLWDEPFLSAPAGDTLAGEYAGIRLLGQIFEFHDVECRAIVNPPSDDA